MSKATWSILGAVVIVVVLAILITMTGCEKGVSVKLEVGQVWEYNKPNDPFVTHCLRRRILALKDGYVKYRHWTTDSIEDIHETFRIGSTSEDIFRSLGTLIDKPVEEETVTVGKNDLVPLIHTTPAMIEYPVLQTEPNIPVWGNGDLPAEFQAFFGDTNGARLDFVQNQAIDKHNRIIVEIAKRVLMLEGADPNEVAR